MARLAVVACLLAVCLFGPAHAQSTYPNFVAAMNQPQISRLSAVVNTLGLAKTFSNPSLKVTVFVPTNQAFAAAEARSPIKLDSLLSNRAIMQQLVYYHIVKEVVRAPLPSGKQLPTFVANRDLTGEGMTVKGAGSSAKIVTPNIQCGAGVAHIIDNVLLFLNVANLGR